MNRKKKKKKTTKQSKTKRNESNENKKKSGSRESKVNAITRTDAWSAESSSEAMKENGHPAMEQNLNQKQQQQQHSKWIYVHRIK